MLQQFTNYIKENHLFTRSETLLVGVSGGIDSVVLLDLLDQAGFSFAIAHCNFKLRGAESDGDEKLVTSLSKKYDARLYKRTFDIAEYAQEHKISIEMAARDLRYRWFETIRTTHHFDFIAVAHHRDDQLETFFLNLARGTGLAGLTGMRPMNGKLVRPLLFASRQEIEKYSHDNLIEFREDSSNLNTDYQRNKIRHDLLPIMELLNPSFRDGLIRTMRYLVDVESIYNQSVRQTWERVSFRLENDYLISIEELKLLNPLQTYLFEFLKPYGFKNKVVNDIVSSLDGISGKHFSSPTYRLVRDRDTLILSPIKNESLKPYYLEEGLKELTLPIHLKISVTEKKDKFKIPDSLNVACIDHDMVQFPLLIRRWKSGDYFRPLGMIGLKKISDFFIDSKLSLPEKENTWILANGEHVVWIIGRRLDDRYKITASTRNILKLEIVK